jgi:hypothetical protein
MALELNTAQKKVEALSDDVSLLRKEVLPATSKRRQVSPGLFRRMDHGDQLYPKTHFNFTA